MKVFVTTWRSGGVDYKALMWTCPATLDRVLIPVEGPRGWTWNGDLERPTLDPSVRIRGAFAANHFFVRNGVVEFLVDSEHAHAGEHLPMNDIPAAWLGEGAPTP